MQGPRITLTPIRSIEPSYCLRFVPLSEILFTRLVVIGPVGSRAMVRLGLVSRARHSRRGNIWPARLGQVQLVLNAHMRVGYLYLMYVSTSCHIVLLPHMHERSRGRVIGLSVRGAHKNQCQ